jgi:hypothetical protein
VRIYLTLTPSQFAALYRGETVQLAPAPSPGYTLAIDYDENGLYVEVIHSVSSGHPTDPRPVPTDQFPDRNPTS